jgi:gliding motility-associated-like protein
VKLIAFNEYFVCPSDTVVWLHIIPDGKVFFPNAFSPNGDGINDVFYLKAEGVAQVEWSIFDRWGRRVARYEDLERGWDGRHENGLAVPEGVYVYKIRARLNDGSRLERSGSITLIR